MEPATDLKEKFTRRLYQHGRSPFLLDAVREWLPEATEAEVAAVINWAKDRYVLTQPAGATDGQLWMVSSNAEWAQIVSLATS